MEGEGNCKSERNENFERVRGKEQNEREREESKMSVEGEGNKWERMKRGECRGW